MRLKRRALHPEQGGCSLRTGDDPVGLLESRQNLPALGLLKHAAHLPDDEQRNVFPPFAMQALGRGKRSTGSIGRSETSA